MRIVEVLKGKYKGWKVECASIDTGIVFRPKAACIKAKKVRAAIFKKWLR